MDLTRLIDRLIVHMTTALYPGTFDPVTNGHLDVLSRDLDSRGQWWLVRQQTGQHMVVGFANCKNLVLVEAWAEVPPTSTLYTWGRNNHAQLGYPKHDQILHQPRDANWEIPEGATAS